MSEQHNLVWSEDSNCLSMPRAVKFVCAEVVQMTTGEQHESLFFQVWSFGLTMLIDLKSYIKMRF
jgi:hypothetical protein